ncbi:FISUMP domain-containing protein [Sphingobacterium sp. Mn56C]|uniref:FISUMP domain-containing protein n=1 Tax=Sphingobacterium sp. Mn56C TaxID=3395261 RepID=UPI003BC22B83
MKKIRKPAYSIGKILMLIVTLHILACNPKSDLVNDISSVGLAKIKFKLTAGVFGGSLLTGTKSTHLDVPQKASVILNNNYYLTAELVPDSSSTGKAIIEEGTKTHNNRAAIESGTLKPGIKYKVVVFDPSGKYIVEKDYTHGSEENEGHLLLDAGVMYSFIVYSINDEVNLPAINFTDNANKTLATARVVALNGSADFMHFRKEMTLNPNLVNNLNVMLKHKFSQITTSIDASSTGYNITEVSSNFSPHSTTATIDLANGHITRSAANANADVVFGTLNTSLVTSKPTIINADVEGDASYNITRISIGSITQTNIVPFNTLTITPGVRYNLKLKINPSDILLYHKDYPAARIDGIIWMRHNLGVDTSLDPDNQMNADRHGNYYQWGRSYRSGSGTATNADPFYGGPNFPAIGSWNNGNETNPIKTPTDPCPEGFRIPTMREYNSLITATSTTNIGNFTAGSSQFSSAKVFTSKINKGVQLTFPAQGFFPTRYVSEGHYNEEGLINRGSHGHYHTSFSSSTSLNVTLFFDTNTVKFDNLGTILSTKVDSYVMRCVAE